MRKISAMLMALLFMLILLPHTAGAAEPQPGGVELLEVRKIWDAGPHNAFTDLIRYKEQWFCAFREAPAHKGGVRDSKIRVLASNDAKAWTSGAELADARGDIRDAKLAVLPDGRLTLLTATQLFDQSKQTHQSIAFFSSDGRSWEGPLDVGDPSVWLWGIEWHRGVGYSIGYGTGDKRFVRLYHTRDGVTYEPLVEKLEVDAKFANESAILFDKDDAARVLLRCDPGPAFLGTARPPYTQWTWKQTPRYVGGPALTYAPNGRILGAGRLIDDKKPRTALFWVDPKSAALDECLTLPSGGDTSYPGLVWEGNTLCVSYYSSHEGKSSIYLARVRFPSPGTK